MHNITSQWEKSSFYVTIFTLFKQTSGIKYHPLQGGWQLILHDRSASVGSTMLDTSWVTAYVTTFQFLSWSFRDSFWCAGQAYQRSCVQFLDGIYFPDYLYMMANMMKFWKHVYPCWPYNYFNFYKITNRSHRLIASSKVCIKADKIMF